MEGYAMSSAFEKDVRTMLYKMRGLAARLDDDPYYPTTVTEVAAELRELADNIDVLYPGL